MPRTFPDQRITVSKKFADPPPEVLSRIDTGDTVSHPDPERRGATVHEVLSRRCVSAATSSFGRRSIVNGERRSSPGTDYRAGSTVVAPARGRIARRRSRMTGGTIII
jgi:hypothetical protein